MSQKVGEEGTDTLNIGVRPLEGVDALNMELRPLVSQVWNHDFTLCRGDGGRCGVGQGVGGGSCDPKRVLGLSGPMGDVR